jgi:hypothetical protein
VNGVWNGHPAIFFDFSDVGLLEDGAACRPAGSTVHGPDPSRASGADRSADLTNRAAGAFSLCTGSNIGDAVRHAMTLAPLGCGTNAADRESTE